MWRVWKWRPHRWPAKIWRFHRDPPYRFRAGSWQQARLRGWDHVIVLTLLIAAGIVRGLDYMTGNDVYSSRDFMLSAAPAWVWGWAFVLGSSILLWGSTTRRHLYVWMGHGWLFIAYAVNAVATAWAREDTWAVVLLGLVIVASISAFLYWRERKWLRWVLGGAPVVGWLATIYLVVDKVPNLDGIRGAFALGTISLLHLLYHLRTGAAPLQFEESEVRGRDRRGGERA